MNLEETLQSVGQHRSLENPETFENAPYEHQKNTFVILPTDPMVLSRESEKQKKKKKKHKHRHKSDKQSQSNHSNGKKRRKRDEDDFRPKGSKKR